MGKGGKETGDTGMEKMMKNVEDVFEALQDSAACRRSPPKQGQGARVNNRQEGVSFRSCFADRDTGGIKWFSRVSLIAPWGKQWYSYGENSGILGENSGILKFVETTQTLKPLSDKTSHPM